jgi:hypothetical protein
MESPTEWDPWSVVSAEHPDVQVIETTLPNQLQGCVDHKKRIIWLATGLTAVQRRCTLAFEIAQLQQGSTPIDPCLAAAHRRAAEDWAALMLIPSESLVRACRSTQTVPGAALLLGVDAATLRARFRGMTDDEQDMVMAALCSQRLPA